MCINDCVGIEYQKILDIYSSEIPDFLLPFLKSPILRRLSNVGQTCGAHYSPLFNYKIDLSRLEHSLGVALIIWKFTKDETQTISGLLHDISHSAFSHIGDFILGDAENQESSEKFISELIRGDSIIIEELKKLSIKIEDVEDYEIYPIADNPGPQLSADRLEYNLSSPYILGVLDITGIAEMYNNLIIGIDEKNTPELSFTSQRLAMKFGFLSIENDSKLFSSHEAVFTMTYLAEIIKKIFEEGELESKDLYSLGDNDIVSIMQENKSQSIRLAWNDYKTTNNISTEDTMMQNENHVSSKCKRRWVDPLVKQGENYVRLSSICSDFKEAVYKHKNQKEVFIKIPSL